ncbi:MAG: hypothetical protein AAB425_09075, partial [Bdellovibrionota bacterium]
MTSPSHGASSSDTTPQVSGTASTSVASISLYGTADCSVLSFRGSATSVAGSFTISAFTLATNGLQPFFYIAAPTSSENPNTACTGTGLSYTLDTGAPSAVTSWSLNPSTGSTSSVTSPTLSGASDENTSVVAAYTASDCNSGSIGSATVASGIFAITSSALTAGAKTFYYTIADSLGNARACTSTAMSITIDTTAPNAVTGWAMSPTSGVTTSVSSPTISGSSDENGAFVNLYTAADCGSGGVGSGTVNGGVFSITTSTVADGTVVFRYRIADTAANSTACATTGLTLTVDARAPAFSYAYPNPTYTKNVVITPNTITSTGGPIDSFSVSPSLPVGMVLNTSIGAITGSISVSTPPKVFTVTATNSVSTATVGVTISVPSYIFGRDPLSVGPDHACVAASDGVYCWGRNGAGQIGCNSTINRPSPIRVTGILVAAQA